MRNLVKAAALVGLVAVLAACSGGSEKKTSKTTKSFTTDGLIAPSGACEIKPSRLGIAKPLAKIRDKGGCGVPDPWQVYSVGGVQLSTPATLNCGMASPLNDWVQQVVQPAAQRAFGEAVAEVNVAASYSCRPRNNRYGAKMSEHGFGNAIDIAGFTLESGREVTVLAGYYGAKDERRFLSSVREDACANFMTVLGPGSDANHRDHIHLDLQNRRSGQHYCR